MESKYERVMMSSEMIFSEIKSLREIIRAYQLLGLIWPEEGMCV